MHKLTTHPLTDALRDANIAEESRPDILHSTRRTLGKMLGIDRDPSSPDIIAALRVKLDRLSAVESELDACKTDAREAIESLTPFVRDPEAPALAGWSLGDVVHRIVVDVLKPAARLEGRSEASGRLSRMLGPGWSAEEREAILSEQSSEQADAHESEQDRELKRVIAELEQATERRLAADAEGAAFKAEKAERMAKQVTQDECIDEIMAATLAEARQASGIEAIMLLGAWLDVRDRLAGRADPG